MVRGSGKRLAVMGAPIAQSKSPRLFAEFFKEYGIHDASYYLLYADGSQPLRLLIEGLGLFGANVTSPLKNVAFAAVDTVSASAQALGAVNTIVNRGGVLNGYNTDPAGVRGALQALGLQPGGRRCYVLGAGGASAAVVYTLRRLQAKPIVVSRSYEHAAGLAERLGASAAHLEQASPRRGDWLFSCLPPGSSVPGWDWSVFEWAFDSVYSDSPLESVAVRYSLPCVGAREWLYHQAVAAFKIFFEEELRIRSTDPSRRA